LEKKGCRGHLIKRRTKSLRGKGATTRGGPKKGAQKKGENPTQKKINKGEE